MTGNAQQRITVTTYSRYSKFDKLFKMLKKNVGAALLPPLPGKTASAHGKTDPAFLEGRRAGLERFLTVASQLPSGRGTHQQILRFLGGVSGWDSRAPLMTGTITFADEAHAASAGGGGGGGGDDGAAAAWAGAAAGSAVSVSGADLLESRSSGAVRGKYPVMPPPYSRGFAPVLEHAVCTRGITESKVTEYEIRVIHGDPGQTFWTYCRYSKFDQLAQLLKATVPACAALPPLPAKTATLHGKSDPKFVEKRRAGLDAFIQALFKTLPDISKCEAVLQFVGLVSGWDTLMKEFKEGGETTLGSSTPVIDFKAELVTKAVLGGGADAAVVAMLKAAFEAEPANQKCFETGTALSLSDPVNVWVSLTFGTFHSSVAAGVHRSLGVQTSFVQSVCLDTWTMVNAMKMRRGGNANAAAGLFAGLDAIGVYRARVGATGAEMKPLFEAVLSAPQARLYAASLASSEEELYAWAH